MWNKNLYILVLFLFFNINLFAHRMPNVEVSLDYMHEDFIKINIIAPNKQSVFANEIKIISLDNKILESFYLTEEKNSFKIPSSPYLVLIKINESLIYKKGIAPLNGFSGKESIFNMENFAFKFFSFLSVLCLLLSIIIFKRKLF